MLVISQVTHPHILAAPGQPTTCPTANPVGRGIKREADA